MESLLASRLRLGRAFGADVYAHWSMAGLAILALFVAFPDRPREALLFFMVAAGSAFLHELGHCWAARRVGGRVVEVVLWPLGGLGAVQAPRHPWSQLAVVAAGPLVSVVLALAGLALFRACGGSAGGWLALTDATTSGPPFLKFVVWVNATLAVLNVIPAFPTDGGRILQALLWPRFGLVRAQRLAASAALACGAFLIVASLFVEPREPFLLALGGVALLGALQERERLQFAGHEPHPLVGSPPAPAEVALSASPALDEARVAELRDRLDDVLAKVSSLGLEGLTPDERRFLDEASHALRQLRSGPLA